MYMYMVSMASTVHAHLSTVPRKPAAKYVDRAGGDRYDLEDSGLLPKYTNKKVQYTLCPGLCVCMEGLTTSLSPSPSLLSLSLLLSLSQEYGKVPGYLEQRKQEMEAAQTEYDQYVEESLRRGRMEQVSHRERWACLRLKIYIYIYIYTVSVC